MARVCSQEVMSTDGPFWGVVAWADRPSRCIVPQLVFRAQSEAEAACDKRNAHPSALALGMLHEVARVVSDHATDCGFREVTL